MPPIQAAGGIVFRTGETGLEILAVHRPRYDDWSLPKGKYEPGETSGQAAVREIEEESGVVARIVAPVAEVGYTLASGEEKVVSYFALRPVVEKPFTPNDEVDATRWMTVEEAGEILTYQRDRSLVAGPDVARLARTGTAFLIRHGAAGDRRGWTGEDRQRPLSAKGARQATALCENLSSTGVDRILTSPYLRCRQTVEPLGNRVGRAVDDHPTLAEGGRAAEVLDLIRHHAGENLALCSHGDVIPGSLDLLLRQGVDVESPTTTLECRKASIWEISVEAGEPVTAIYHPPPSVGAGSERVSRS